jgi:phage terminase large subunit-like protein
VYELVCSLGIKASLNRNKSYLCGVEKKDRYRIHFSTTYDVFRLTRKVSKINKSTNQVLRINRRYITKISEVESVPTRCIKVDSPTSTFLVTESFIATHNTRTASEWLAREAWADKNAGRYGIFGRSLNDIKRNQILGDSGLVETFKRMGLKVAFDRKDLTLTLVNGVQIYCFSSDTPDAVRGNNLSGAWFDELASYYNLRDTWDQAVLALRKGGSKAIITTTPKIVAGQLLIELMNDSDCYVTEGDSFQNAPNLTKKYIKHLKKNANTRLGQQEIYAKILDDSGVLFKENWIQRGVILPENCEKIVVSVDPAMSNNGKSNEHGIIVAGKNGERGFVFADLSCVGTANHAASVAIEAFRTYNADYIVVEKNQGGMWLESVFKSLAPNIPVKLVTASRGKLTRAEPVAALYEQSKIFHCKEFVLLETQMRTFDPEGEAFKKGTNKSPDRLDALVWAFTALYEEKSFKPFIINSPVGIF